MASSDPAQELKTHLAKNCVPQEVIDYITKEKPNLNLKSISQFASIFKESDYEDGCKDQIIEKVEECKGDLGALASLRTAWILARSDLQKAVKSRIEGRPEADWDAPLDKDEEKARKDFFDGAYDSFEWIPEKTPASQLVSRFYRETHSEKRDISVFPLEKVRSAAEYKVVGTGKRKHVGGGLSYESEAPPRLPDLVFSSLPQLFLAFGLMTNSWAMAGAHMVTSKKHFEKQGEPKQVRECHLGKPWATMTSLKRKPASIQGQTQDNRLDHGPRQEDAIEGKGVVRGRLALGGGDRGLCGVALLGSLDRRGLSEASPARPRPGHDV